MIGSALLRKLEEKNSKVHTITKAKLDLRNQEKVFKYLNKLKPEKLLLLLRRWRNFIQQHLRGEFIYDNLSIQNNIIHGSYKSGVKKLIFLGSSCI